jgi:WD40 repeat protein
MDEFSNLASKCSTTISTNFTQRTYPTVCSIVFCSNHPQIILCEYDDFICIFNLDNFKLVKKESSDKNSIIVTSLDIAPDDAFLAFAFSQGTFGLF